MKIIKKGNPKGLDKDYSVYVDSVDEVEQLHESLLAKGLLFMYQTGDEPYNPHSTSFYILHYIDEKLKLYDYAIFLPNTTQATKKAKESYSELDISYQKAKSNPHIYKQLMKYMKFKKLLYAFRKNMKAYGHFSQEHMNLFNEVLGMIKSQTGLELESISQETLVGLDTRLKHFFGV